MIDPSRLNQLLEELYAIEPALRAQDASLRRLAAELLASRPEASLDERFVARLRNELMARTAVPRFSLMNFFTSKNRFLVPSLAILLLAVVGAVTLQTGGKNPASPSKTAAAASSLQRREANAFGQLAFSSGASSPSTTTNKQADAPTPTQAPEISAVTPSTSPAPSFGRGGGGMGGTATEPAIGKMIAPDFVPMSYRYTYGGDAIDSLLASQFDVYRRVKGAPDASSFSALRNLNLGSINLGKVQDGRTQSFTVVENRDNGYMFTVDLQEGMASIYQNSKWTPSPLLSCRAQNCWEQNRLKESDLMPSDEAIRIADAFLSGYGISKEGYASPVINDQWRVYYDKLPAAEKSSYWFPDAMTIVYPILVEGKSAADSAGQPYGLSVNVDIRTKQVQAVYNLYSRNYEVSSYAAETDAKRLIKAAESTDQYGTMPQNTKYIDVELGTPTLIYASMWQSGSTGVGSEVLAPALAFPVKKAPEDFWRQTVIVPLIKDILDAPNNGPIPLDAKAVNAPSPGGVVNINPTGPVEAVPTPAPAPVIKK